MSSKISATTTSLIIIGCVVAIVLIIYNFTSESPIHNSGSLDIDMPADTPYSDVDAEMADHPLNYKMMTKNSAKSGYKRMNYSEGDRAQETSEVSDENILVENTEAGENAGFVPRDGADGKFASYQSSGIKTNGMNQINSDDFLPKEETKDWFETMPEPISVKNRHLINVTRAVGVNTIGSSHKNASYDIRGNPPCPKFVVSPWLQSSIEPDLNIKGLC